jgi:hypothetical protein
MSDGFGLFMILHNLDCVPELLELSVSYGNLVDQSEFLATEIHKVKRLQIFKYRTYCTDEVMLQLRLHCPHLMEVDITNSINVTNDSALNLIELKELKWLNIAGTRIDNQHYGFIISELPNIANIRLWQNQNAVLLHIGVETLDSITHIHGSFHDMDALSQMCPNTTNITFSTVSTDLSRLTAFNALRALEIYDIDCERSNLNAILTDMGHRLQDLTLFQCSGANLQHILTLCPSMLNLTLQWCSFLQFNIPIDLQLPHFRNLINLKVKTNYGDLIDFRYIRYYVGLETIHLIGVSIFTVEFVREIISLGTFTQLKAFHVKESKPGTLTMEALQLLIRHCPLLQRIKSRIHWPRVDRLDICELQRQMLEKNFEFVIE